SASVNIKRDIDTIRASYSGINLVLQPVVRYLLSYYPHIPGEPGTEIPPASAEGQSTSRSTRGEHRVVLADLSSFTEGNNIVRFLHRFGRRFALCSSRLLDWLLLCVLLRNRNRLLFFANTLGL